TGGWAVGRGVPGSGRADLGGGGPKRPGCCPREPFQDDCTGSGRPIPGRRGPGGGRGPRRSDARSNRQDLPCRGESIMDDIELPAAEDVSEEVSGDANAKSKQRKMIIGGVMLAGLLVVCGAVAREMYFKPAPKREDGEAAAKILTTA